MLEAIRHLINREDAEFLFFLAQTLIVLIAVAALLYARAEVHESKRYAAIIARHAQATFLLKLVDEWNSAQMRRARRCFVAHSKKSQEEVFIAHHHLNDKATMDLVREHFRVQMRKLMEENISGDYSALMTMCAFFETVGLLVRQDYVAVEDIDALFRGPILDLGIYFLPHIEDRQKEKGVPSGLYENAVYLMTRIEKGHPTR